MNSTCWDERITEITSVFLYGLPAAICFLWAGKRDTLSFLIFYWAIFEQCIVVVYQQYCTILCEKYCIVVINIVFWQYTWNWNFESFLFLTNILISYVIFKVICCYKQYHIVSSYYQLRNIQYCAVFCEQYCIVVMNKRECFCLKYIEIFSFLSVT